MYIQSIYLFGCTKNLNDYDAQTILCRNKICININHFFLLLIAILFVTYVKNICNTCFFKFLSKNVFNQIHD